MNGFSKFRKFNKTNIKEVPDNKPIVYRFKNNGGEELYDGVAKRNRAYERLLEHLTKKSEKIPGVSKFSIKQMSNIEAAERIEKKLIKKLSPKFNEED